MSESPFVYSLDSFHHINVHTLCMILLEYCTNFHRFYEERNDPSRFTGAHNALYNMKVLNRNGSISDEEWDVSRMYLAVKFRKVRESQIDMDDEDVGKEEMLDPN